MNKKYILTEEYKNIIVSDNQSKRVFRIMAIRSFGGVKAGQLGGFVEKEKIFRMRMIVLYSMMQWSVMMHE